MGDGQPPPSYSYSAQRYSFSHSKSLRAPNRWIMAAIKSVSHEDGSGKGNAMNSTVGPTSDVEMSVTSDTTASHARYVRIMPVIKKVSRKDAKEHRVRIVIEEARDKSEGRVTATQTKIEVPRRR